MRSFGGDGVSCSEVLILTAPSAVIDSLTVELCDSLGCCSAAALIGALIGPIISACARFLALHGFSSSSGLVLLPTFVLLRNPWSSDCSKLERGLVSETMRSCVLDAEADVLLSGEDVGLRISGMLEAREWFLGSSLVGECDCAWRTSKGTPWRK